MENNYNASEWLFIPNLSYEDLQETLAMLEMIVQGNKNLTDGRYRPAGQVLKEFEERIEKDFSWFSFLVLSTAIATSVKS